MLAMPDGKGERRTVSRTILKLEDETCREAQRGHSRFQMIGPMVTVLEAPEVFV